MSQNRILDSIRQIVREVFAAQTFLGQYRYSVKSSNGTGRACTVDVEPVNKSIGLPAHTNVPIRPGVLGEFVDNVPEGTLATVIFLDGSPALPRVVAFEGLSTNETVDAGDTLNLGPTASTTNLGGGGAGVVGLSDIGLAYFPSPCPISGVINGTQPFVGTIAIPGPGIVSMQTSSNKVFRG